MTMSRVTRFVLVLLSACFLPVALHAQDMVVRGALTGPDGTAISGERVLLHRVDRSGGATIAETSSAADGAFVLTAPATTDTAAVYFVAARFQGELYIGEMFRTAGADTLEQPLQVGVSATSASEMLSQASAPPAATGRPATSTSWLLLLIPLAGVGAVVIYMLVPRTRIAPDRALFIRIAEIDERFDAAPPGQRDSLRAERANLVEQLRAG